MKVQRKCPDCRNQLEACSCEPWWRAFQEGFYEALDRRMNSRPLAVRMPEGVEPPEDLRIDLQMYRLNPAPTNTVCDHDAPLALVTDAQAMCWGCGLLFELKAL